MSLFGFSSAINNLVGNTAGANVSNLVTVLNDLKTFINGKNIDSDNIAANGVSNAELALATQQQLGLNDGSQIGRGKNSVSTEESRSNTAYGTLTTADQVDNIVLPTDGLIFVAYRAMWKQSVASAAKAAIFVGSNQLSLAADTVAAPAVQETSMGSTATATYGPLVSYMLGLFGEKPNTTAYTGDVTTGQAVGVNDNGGTRLLGGPVAIFAAAGTYDISVQFKASSGSVTAKNRTLWVWTVGF